jgi:uncharacterized protein HemX
VRRLLLIALVLLSVGVAPAVAGAQDDPTTSSTVAELPPADIIPRPNSGTAPEEAGDRGGALQLGLLALVVVVLAGGVVNVVRQSRRARAGRDA